MSTSSVFPLEIYEHILEMCTDNETWFLWQPLMRNWLSYVCTAWRPKCRTLVFRRVMISIAGMKNMHALRRHFITYPHLAPLVEAVDFYLHVDEYQSMIEAFPFVLGRFLPRLREISILSEIRFLNIHPHFSIRRIELRNVTVLGVAAVIFDPDFTLSWLIAPFPSLRSLDLHDVYWLVVPDLKRLPPLREVGLGLIPIRTQVAWRKENREAYECFLREASPTMQTLTINLPVIYILTSRHKENSNNFDLGTLEVLNLEIYCSRSYMIRGEDKEILPYSQSLSDMVSILLRLDANKMRILNLSFDTEEIASSGDDEFLNNLRGVRQGLEDIVVGKRFPSLQAINVDVGAGGAAVPVWQDRFDSCFPLLAKRQLLRVKEHIHKL